MQVFRDEANEEGNRNDPIEWNTTESNEMKESGGGPEADGGIDQ